jgi:hypothetical protein
MAVWRVGGSLTSHHGKLGHYRVRMYFSVPVFVNAFSLHGRNGARCFDRTKKQHKIYRETR